MEINGNNCVLGLLYCIGLRNPLGLQEDVKETGLTIWKGSMLNLATLSQQHAVTRRE